jgi:hypothetical protein
MIFICRLAAFLDLNSLRDSEPDFFMKQVPFSVLTAFVNLKNLFQKTFPYSRLHTYLFH